MSAPLSTQEAAKPPAQEKPTIEAKDKRPALFFGGAAVTKPTKPAVAEEAKVEVAPPVVEHKVASENHDWLPFFQSKKPAPAEDPKVEVAPPEVVVAKTEPKPAPEAKEKKPFFHVAKKPAAVDEPKVEEPTAPAKPIEAEPAEAQPSAGIIGWFKWGEPAQPVQPPVTEPVVEAPAPEVHPASKVKGGLFSKKPAAVPAAAEKPSAEPQPAAAEPTVAQPSKKAIRFPFAKAAKPAEPEVVEPAKPAVVEESALAKAPTAEEPGFFDGLVKASTSSIEFITGAFTPRSAEEAPVADVHDEPDVRDEPVEELAQKKASRNCVPGTTVKEAKDIKVTTAPPAPTPTASAA